MRNGQLSKQEMATLNRAWDILSRWAEWSEADAEKHGYEPDADYAYVNAMSAVCGLCEFLLDYDD